MQWANELNWALFFLLPLIQQPENKIISADDFSGGYDSDGDSSFKCSDNPVYTVRAFQKPKLNVEAKVYYKTVNMNLATLTEPPITL